MSLKPKVLLDIKPSSGTSVHQNRKRLINLSYKKTTKLSLGWWFLLPVLALVPVLLLGRVVAPMASGTLAQTVDKTEERQVLESELQDLEKQIGDYEKTISVYKSQGASLQGEINSLNAKVNKLNLQIKAVSLSLQKLDDEISSTNTQINSTEITIGSTKEVLSKSLRLVYESDDNGMMEILLKSPQLSDFFTNVNDLLSVQDSLRVSLGQLKSLKDELFDEKEILGLQRADAAALKAYQALQKKDVEGTKKEKDSILKTTKGKESEYQKLLAETKTKAAEIRSRIYRLLGGGELPFGEAVTIAQIAERATGVRAAFILSVLTQESAVNGVIGGNLGRCYYNTPWTNASGTVMSNSQKPAFLGIMAEIKSDPNTTPVSCPIISDGSYGGAMGPAQFMPTTWVPYKDKISAITGGSPPSPFNNLDAFTATALLLKDNLTKCGAIYSTIFSKENCAAARYYAGGNWRLYTRVGRYGYRVAERAQGFEDDIELLAKN